MTEINHKENLINFIDKLKQCKSVEYIDFYITDERIGLMIIGKNFKFECYQDYNTELCRSLFLFLNQMFVI